MLIFSCVCAVQFWRRFRRSCKVLQDYVGVHCGFVDLKKKLTTDSGVKPLALESEKPSGVLTEICGWRRRKFFNHFLPAFSFFLQNQFLIRFLQKVGKRDAWRLPLSCQKTFFPSKDSAQPNHFLLHKEELASYPVLFLLFHLSFSVGI